MEVVVAGPVGAAAVVDARPDAAKVLPAKLFCFFESTISPQKGTFVKMREIPDFLPEL